MAHLLNDTIQSLLPAIYPVLQENYAPSFTQIGVLHFVFQFTASLLQPAVAAKLIRHIATPTALVEPLTEREEEVLNYLAQGLQNKEIAGRLGISERTVKFHVSAVLTKLGAGNRTEAVHLARQQGLIT